VQINSAQQTEWRRSSYRSLLLGVKKEELEECCRARWEKRVIMAVVMKFDLTLLIEGREERVNKTCKSTLQGRRDWVEAAREACRLCRTRRAWGNCRAKLEKSLEKVIKCSG